MAVNPLQMILAEPVTAFQRGRQAGTMDRANQRRELEETRAFERQNKLRELAYGVNADSDREQVLTQAQQVGGLEGRKTFDEYFTSLDANKQAKVKAEYEGIARTIAQIDALPPEQQDAAYAQVSQQLPPDWQGLPYRQARGRAVAMIAPAEKLFASQESQGPKVVGAGGALVGPDGRVLFQAPNRPQAPIRGQVVTDPTTGEVYTVDPVTGQARRVTLGGGPTQTPTMDALAAQANQMIAQGIPPEQVDAWLQSQTQASPNVQIDRQLPPLDQWGAGDERGNQLRLQPRPKAGQAQEPGGIPPISSKDATTARLKLNQVQTARQQLARVKQQFAAIQNTLSAGGFGQGMVPTEAGQQFDRAVAQLNPLITAITRVPGVGAMSDYETRLQQAAMPARGNYESTTLEQLQGIEDLLNQTEEGYRTLLNQPAKGQESSADIDALLEKYK